MRIIAAQGELRVYEIDSLPDNIGTNRPSRNERGDFILAHSEKGHHHVIGGDVDVIEHTEVQKMGDQSLAMRTLYAIVNQPTTLRQTATDAHTEVNMDAGIYAIRADVEFDPFGDQIREVQD